MQVHKDYVLQFYGYVEENASQYLLFFTYDNFLTSYNSSEKDSGREKLYHIL